MEIDVTSGIRKDFIKDWSEVATAWGISKKMAAIHGYLMTAEKQVSADEIQRDLEISRGCISTNLSQLESAGLVRKIYIKDSRKEYYEAEKNTYKILQAVIAIRREKELTPLLTMMEKYCPTQMNGELSSDSINLICDMRHYAVKSDRFLSMLENKDESLFVRSFLNMIK